MKSEVQNLVPRFRSARAAAVVVFGLLTSHLGLAAVPSASVVAVQPAGEADLIMLSSGFDAGLRQGMVCRLTRGTAEIAEVLIVDLRPTCSAALILSLVPKQSIRAGDLASIKVLKS
ncbi:MAG: hypothetical protein V4773_09790 [Verrucomicrobiota bacterium]